MKIMDETHKKQIETPEEMGVRINRHTEKAMQIKGVQAFQRMLKYIEQNCLNCQKGCNQEGYAPGDELYCDICNTLENRIGWLDEDKLSLRMRKRMNYPDGPCVERIDRRQGYELL